MWEKGSWKTVFSHILCCGLFPEEGFIIIVDLLGNFFKIYLVFLRKAKLTNALFSSRFKKNLVDFSQYLYQSHFLQTLIPVVITSSSFSQALYYWIFFLVSSLDCRFFKKSFQIKPVMFFLECWTVNFRISCFRSPQFNCELSVLWADLKLVRSFIFTRYSLS